jgi:hypothetical protein
MKHLKKFNEGFLFNRDEKKAEEILSKISELDIHNNTIKHEDSTRGGNHRDKFRVYIDNDCIDIQKQEIYGWVNHGPILPEPFGSIIEPNKSNAPSTHELQKIKYSITFNGIKLSVSEKLIKKIYDLCYSLEHKLGYPFNRFND